jgi:hypothetical protein
LLSARIAPAIAALTEDWRRLDERIDQLSGEIAALARQDGCCERLMSVPGIGLIIDFLGNSRIEAANNLRLAGELGKVPPFLHFTKPSVGQVRFNGLCSLVDVRHSWFEDHGHPVKNLRLLLSILDAEEVNAAWLRERAVSSDLSMADGLAPDVWHSARKGDVQKRQMWAQRVRSIKDQLPIPGSSDEKVLEEIRALTPNEFENFVVALVAPDKVSRLVARLGRGQYGLFFTTSCFSIRAQKEVIVDRYPVRLFSGLNIFWLRLRSRLQMRSEMAL